MNTFSQIIQTLTIRVFYTTDFVFKTHTHTHTHAHVLTHLGSFSKAFHLVDIIKD